MTPAHEVDDVATTWLGGRIEASTRTLGLALGDLAMVAAFVALGEFRHGGSLAAGVETFAQFGVAWLVVGAAAAVYAPDALGGARRAVLRGVAAWVLAALVGQLIRLLATPGTAVVPSFVLVSIGFGGLFIGAWRYVAARSVSARGRPS